jgi:TRIAD3 protein (E3 ubiquitin-protein ligase RNF216)
MLMRDNPPSEICCKARAPHRFLACDDRKTKHTYCEVCVRQHLLSTIFEKASPWMRCLGSHCVAFYKRADYERILDQDALAMRDRLEARAALKNVKGLTACPACDFTAFVAPGREVFDCLNTGCLKSFCLRCKECPHYGQTCRQARGQRQKEAEAAVASSSSNPGQGRVNDVRHKVEEYITEALIRHCRDCGIRFVKDSGCNEMHCICGNVSCYACRAQHIGHEHWSRGACR